MPLSRPFKEDRLSSVSSFCASLLQAIEGVMSLAVCPYVVSISSSSTQSSFFPFSIGLICGWGGGRWGWVLDDGRRGGVDGGGGGGGGAAVFLVIDL